MISATLAASEAFKQAMRRLSTFARNPEMFALQFQPFCESMVSLAPEATQLARDLGPVDIISAGAVTNAALFALLRIPDASGKLRVIEPQDFEDTNHNRCMLMTSTSPGQPKAVEVAAFQTASLSIVPVTSTFQEAVRDRLIVSLAERVIVGVDDIPTRWEVQRAAPSWLSIGATTHWSAMSSFHVPNRPCARCLHPRDDDGGAAYAPTISFVSFWAGLWSAAFLIRSLADNPIEPEWVFFTPTGLACDKDFWRGTVRESSLCPVHGAHAS